MLFLKIMYHLQAFVVLMGLKLLYSILGGGKLIINQGVRFRKGFSLMIDKRGEVIIGKHVFFNNYCSLNALEHISIGEGSIFGENVKIYDHNHYYKNPDIPIKEQGYTSAPIKIGKHCWIASNVTILKGVTIGDNCVIGAGYTIYKDIPNNSIVVNKQELIIK